MSSIPAPSEVRSAGTAKAALFSPAQADHLNRIFPEIVGNDQTTDAQLRIQQGVRKVVQYVITNSRV